MSRQKALYLPVIDLSVFHGMEVFWQRLARRIAAAEPMCCWGHAGKTYTTTYVKEVLKEEAARSKAVNRQAGGTTGDALPGVVR
ncbi:hypothetical protein CN878_20570 [Ochrobactrum sp. 695/2009]|nr:hypothetical protein CN881_12830 [Ochrobactrum sp. 721/2009]PJT16642.1 hypothetical protein CN880_09905 [Ochrobactrum sp. 720/2009]PJT26464.1 hypothetical protein CN879_05870 [Ochrobactrum sp. 715/2009]PJT26846.1 hypothetical protein CN878_20570 [Ochrobactrum sp. 695/2009]PJT35984.1 hypothetical protein CN877_08315 [Ochrobactrum sp. 689/2009]